MSEARTEDRLGRLEEDVRDIKATLAQLLPLIVRSDERLQHLATKAELTVGLSDLRTEMTVGLSDLRTEMTTGLSDLRTGIADLRTVLADKPSRGYLWGVMAAMVGAQAVALAAAALMFSIIIPPAHGAEPPQRPYSCRLLDDEQRKCAFGSCDARTVDRLRKECLRDGGRP